MKKTGEKNEPLVPSDVKGLETEKRRLSFVGRYATESNEGQKPEKMWFVQLGPVRRHSRTLYLPLDANIVNLFRIKKGDKIKFMLLQLIRAPAEDAPIREVETEEPQESPSEEENMDEGELYHE